MSDSVHPIRFWHFLAPHLLMTRLDFETSSLTVPNHSRHSTRLVFSQLAVALNRRLDASPRGEGICGLELLCFAFTFFLFASSPYVQSAIIQFLEVLKFIIKNQASKPVVPANSHSSLSRKKAKPKLDLRKEEAEKRLRKNLQRA